MPHVTDRVQVRAPLAARAAAAQVDRGARAPRPGRTGGHARRHVRRRARAWGYAFPVWRAIVVVVCGMCHVTIIRYNMLAEIYATQSIYPYVAYTDMYFRIRRRHSPDAYAILRGHSPYGNPFGAGGCRYSPVWALDWNFRKRSLMRELRSYNADILCLQVRTRCRAGVGGGACLTCVCRCARAVFRAQEVQADHFESFVYPELKAAGFEGLYKQKTREPMGMEGKVDGCALFFKAARFTLLEKYVIRECLCVRVFRVWCGRYASRLCPHCTYAYPFARLGT